MRKLSKTTMILHILIAPLLLAISKTHAAPLDTRIVTLNDNAGWCWFQDERAIEDLARVVDPARFEAQFGAPLSRLGELVAAKTVTIPKLMVNACAGNISIRHHLRGVNSATATACACFTAAWGGASSSSSARRAATPSGSSAKAAGAPATISDLPTRST